MRCIEAKVRGARGRLRPLPALVAAAVVLAGCGSPPPAAPPARPPAAPAPGPVLTLPPRPSEPSPSATPSTPAAAARAPRYVKLPPPQPARNWDEFKLVAARRLVDAHPDTSYMGVPPEPLLGIPVLEIELNADGSVRFVKVVREPREAKETIQMAIDAVRRAAPYGDVSRLSRPWKFVEVFLFDDDHRFKPATLDR